MSYLTSRLIWVEDRKWPQLVPGLALVGAVAFIAAAFLYASRGPDSGAIQLILYGLVGFIPATISSWLAHEVIDQPVVAV